MVPNGGWNVSFGIMTYHSNQIKCHTRAFPAMKTTRLLLHEAQGHLRAIQAYAYNGRSELILLSNMSCLRIFSYEENHYAPRYRQNKEKKLVCRMCVLCVGDEVINDSRIHHTGVYSQAKLLLWPEPLRAPRKRNNPCRHMNTEAHVVKSILCYSIHRQKLACEAKKAWPSKKTQLFQKVGPSVCLQTHMSLCLNSQEIVVMTKVLSVKWRIQKPCSAETSCTTPDEHIAYSN